MKPKIASMPVGILVCFLFCFSSTMTLDLWNYFKGNSGSRLAPTLSVYIAHCQHWATSISIQVPSVPCMLVISQIPRAHLFSLTSWTSLDMMASQTSVWGEWQLEGFWSDIDRHSISRAFST